MNASYNAHLTTESDFTQVIHKIYRLVSMCPYMDQE
jgi:hypothetical protein